MSRSSPFRCWRRLVQTAELAERLGLSSRAAMEQAAAVRQASAGAVSRRQFFKATGALGAGAWGAGRLAGAGPAQAAPRRIRDLSVGVVGGGLAGLLAARELTRAGATVTIYEAADRLGGRIHSLRNTFPGQVAELGGELIDTLSTTMLGLAREFDLEVEDVNKVDGEVFYHFFDQHYSETEVVDDLRQFVPIMKADVRALSKEVSATSFTLQDRRQDLISLEEYLDGSNGRATAASPLLREVIRAAYTIEYGQDLAEQSSLNFLHFIHPDNRSNFTPWGLFSDERYHIVGGNDQIVTRLGQQLVAQIELGRRLCRVARRPDGRVQLTFGNGPAVTRTHDRVILAIPFTTLRDVELDASLALPQWKLDVIARFSLGVNSKQMVGFQGRPWAAVGSTGASYADLPKLNCTWETNVSRSSPQRSILTNFSGGLQALLFDPSQPQREAEGFLNSLDQIFPGAKAQAAQDGGGYRTVVANWFLNPLARGGYTCYRPGQFTTLAGLEGAPLQNLHFAGEHTDSFYSWQGFMEGACLSGLRVAREILR